MADHVSPIHVVSRNRFRLHDLWHDFASDYAPEETAWSGTPDDIICEKFAEWLEEVTERHIIIVD